MVYGHPAVAVAISRGVEISVSESNSWTVENRPLCPNRHPHLNWLVKRNKLTDRPMSIKISSELFPAAGQGSSAALSVAAQLALAESIGLSTNPIDAAITARDWHTAVTLVGDQPPEVARPFYKKIGFHYAHIRQHDLAEKYYLRAGLPVAAF